MFAGCVCVLRILLGGMFQGAISKKVCTYVVLVEKRYTLSAEVRVRFYESWDNGDPLTTRFKFEYGTRAHASVPARYMLRVIAEPI